MSRKDCPAGKLVCYNCGLTGHEESLPEVYGIQDGSYKQSVKEESVMFANNTPDSYSTYTAHKHNRMQTIAVPHLVWNGNDFR